MLIQGVGTYVPAKKVSLDDLQEKLGLNRYQKEIFTRFHGIRNIPVAENLLPKDMLRLAIEDLRARIRFDLKEIDTVIYCHTIQQVAVFPHNPLAELANEMGFERAELLSLTMQNCASSLTALDLVRQILPADSPHKALILTGERAFSPSVQLIPHTTIMGDGASAVLLGNEGDVGEVLSVHQRTLGQFADGVGLDSTAIKAFEEAYVPTLCDVLRNAAEKAGTHLERIQWIAPHNINMTSWRKVAAALSFPLKQIHLKHMAEQGHCFCSDPFLNYRSLKDEGAIEKDSLTVLASVGLGATFAAAVVRG